MSSELHLKRFGRYLLLDHLVDGGMAKIYRARYLDDKAKRIVAIKMIKKQFCKDENFKKMFMDEIKITFSLVHPNIVQTYDYGSYQGQLYVAIEYCDGKNLKQFLDKLGKNRYIFPIDITVFIASQICQGLNYAHDLRDKLSGDNYNIIHRDISPHNIMLTYDGSVKIIDFGIAKADTNNPDATRVGTIKGKLSYLAPEYIEGKIIDPRYDQFCVGITIWEMLCARRLFKAENDLALLQLIKTCKIPPPSSINPKVPKEVDDIVMKALSRDRNDRYENMDKMNRQLIKFLYSNYPDFNSTDLSFFAKKLFETEIKEDGKKLYSYGKIDISKYLKEFKGENKRIDSGDTKAAETKVPDNDSEGSENITKKEVNIFDFGFEKESNKTSTVDKKSNITSATKSKPLKRSIKLDNTVTRQSSVMSTSKILGNNTVLTMSKSVKVKPNKKIKYLQIAALFLIIIGTLAYIILPNYSKDNNSKRDVAQTESNKNTVQLVLNNLDRFKQKVYVNSKLMKVDFLNRINITPGKGIVIRVEKKGFIPFVKKMDIDNYSEYELNVEISNLGGVAYLFTSRNCVVGQIEFNLYGENRIATVPINNSIAFPIYPDKSNSFIVFFKKLGTSIQKKITITFKSEEQRVDLCELL